MTELAQRATIQIGAIAVEGFMLSDSSYRMSQAQAASAIGESPVYALRFLQTNDSKALLGEGYTDYTPESIEIESDPSRRGQSRINALPLPVVSAYWLYRAYRGNKQALALSWALMLDALERRFDAAFGVERSEQDRDERLASTLEQMEGYLKEAMDYEVLAQAESQYLRNWITRMGYDPDDLPDPSDEE